jgi:hypothetical protein
VQYPAGSGIGAFLGSSVWLDHDVVANCTTGLLVVDSSRAAIVTGTIRNNSGQGVWVLGNSSLVTNLSTVIQNNGGAGVYALNHSFAQITATSITGNGGMGVFAQIASEVWFFPPGSTVTGNGNGVAVQDLSWANFYGSQTTVSGSTAQPDIQCWGHFSGASSAADAGSTNCQP